MKTIIPILCIFFLCGCCQLGGGKTSESQQLLSQQQATQIAKEKFLQLGYGPIEQYKMTVTDEHDSSKWSFFFTRNSEYVIAGDHVAIDVDKRTGETKVFHGE